MKKIFNRFINDICTNFGSFINYKTTIQRKYDSISIFRNRWNYNYTPCNK